MSGPKHKVTGVIQQARRRAASGKSKAARARALEAALRADAKALAMYGGISGPVQPVVTQKGPGKRPGTKF